MSTTEELTGMDETTAARFCEASYDELVRKLMAVVDLFDVAQRDGKHIDVDGLRKHLGPQLRESAVDHATALAALTLIAAPEYTEELLTYAESFKVA